MEEKKKTNIFTKPIAKIIMIVLAVLLVGTVVLAVVPANGNISFDKNGVEIMYYNTNFEENGLTNTEKPLTEDSRKEEIDTILNLLDESTKTNVISTLFGVDEFGQSININIPGVSISESSLISSGSYIRINMAKTQTIKVDGKEYKNHDGLAVNFDSIIIKLADIEDKWAPIQMYFQTESGRIENEDGDTAWVTSTTSYYEFSTYGNLYELSEYVNNLKVFS